MDTSDEARLAPLEAELARLRDDLAAGVDIVAQLVDEAVGQPTPGQLPGAAITLAALQRRFADAKRQRGPAGRVSLLPAVAARRRLVAHQRRTARTGAAAGEARSHAACGDHRPPERDDEGGAGCRRLW
jgi:hypothetical protein